MLCELIAKKTNGMIINTDDLMIGKAATTAVLVNSNNSFYKSCNIVIVIGVLIIILIQIL